MDYFAAIKKNKRLAAQINDLCDFSLAEKLSKLDPAYGRARETFRVFGTDASGGVFGFVGAETLAQHPVAYVSSEGSSGKIAANLSDFFHLIVFYPFWQDLLHLQATALRLQIESLEREYQEMIENYAEMQEAIARQLDLTQAFASVEKFRAALAERPRFIIYSEDELPYDDLWRE